MGRGVSRAVRADLRCASHTVPSLGAKLLKSSWLASYKLLLRFQGLQTCLTACALCTACQMATYTQTGQAHRFLQFKSSVHSRSGTAAARTHLTLFTRVLKVATAGAPPSCELTVDSSVWRVALLAGSEVTACRHGCTHIPLTQVCSRRTLMLSNWQPLTRASE